jgi:kynurenine formamidase
MRAKVRAQRLTSKRVETMPGQSSSRNIKVSRQAVDEAFKALSNWGRWGRDDQIGTLNHVTPAAVVAAAGLIKRGRTFALGIPLGQSGPQRGLFGKRWNPIHTMLATGTDALAGRQPRLAYADDAINMPIQSATHWDSLGHIFYEGKMYNGHDASNVDSNGLGVLGIEHAKDKLVGRGVLLDIARFKGVGALADGYGISNDELEACAAAQGVQIRKGDFVIIRTGQMEACNNRGEWGGYAGGDAPGLKFESCYWLHEKEVAGVCSDTWGVEVRPNETPDVNQPWHWVVIPAMGLYMGEMFNLKELAEDCAADKAYEFFFCGAPLIIPGGTGSPINPQAIK